MSALVCVYVWECACLRLRLRVRPCVRVCEGSFFLACLRACRVWYACAESEGESERECERASERARERCSQNTAQVHFTHTHTHTHTHSGTMAVIINVSEADAVQPGAKYTQFSCEKF
jgi:hypothetical protein